MNSALPGFDDWFKSRIDPDKLDGRHIARVTAVFKNSYTISDGTRERFAEITGKLMFNAESALEYPVVGDWIYAQFFEGDSLAVIHDLLPRKSLLKRKTAGKRIDFQPIAANVDTALIIQSLDGNFNINRLERYLVMINESGEVTPVVLLSKSDLLDEKIIEERKTRIRELMPDVPVFAYSTVSGKGLPQVREALTPEKTFCLLGSSGVGKSTLLNVLLGEEVLKTHSVRETDGKGRHTTSHRQMMRLSNGALIIDTPGMRELGNIGVETGLDETFDEIGALAEACRFKDCTHVTEKGCAVLAAVSDGTLSKKRYENYIKMRKESAYNEMTYYEKRRRDKQLGKFYKSVMQHKKGKR